MSGQTLDEIDVLLAEVGKINASGKMFTYTPYPKQREFMDLGSKYRVRYLRAGNQVGKTMCASTEVAYHLTGQYPKWWTGKRFHKAIRAWAAGEGGMIVRDSMQEKLCGTPTGDEADFGTGSIPRECFTKKPTLSHGVTNAYDTIFVKHKSGGVSTLSFKSYEQGRKKFQAESVDLVWLDEEPSEDIYGECLTRTMAVGGILMTTFTPLNGETPLVKRFMAGDNVDACEVHMTIYDALHYTDEQRKKIIADWPEHQRSARAMGLPYLGDNAVFEEVNKEMLSIPLRMNHGLVFHRDVGEIDTSAWSKLWGIDFGIGHPFAAVLLGWNKDMDDIMVLDGFKITGGVPKQHAERMKAIAANVPVAWPHDGNQRDKGSGIQLAKYYKAEGLNMMGTHATFADGGYGTEAGVKDMLIRMRSERFHVAEGFTAWWTEFFSYYRKDGLIVKKDDDLLSATRIGVMQIRSAKQVALGSRASKPPPQTQRYTPIDDLWGA